MFDKGERKAFTFINLLVFNSLITWHQCSRPLNGQSTNRYSLSMISTELKMGKNEKSNPLSKSNTKRILKDFCESTSLHGYGYIYNNESIALKFFWLFTPAGAKIICDKNKRAFHIFKFFEKIFQKERKKSWEPAKQHNQCDRFRSKNSRHLAYFLRLKNFLRLSKLYPFC